jgi:hypothetical protein
MYNVSYYEVLHLPLHGPLPQHMDHLIQLVIYRYCMCDTLTLMTHIDLPSDILGQLPENTYRPWRHIIPYIVDLFFSLPTVPPPPCGQRHMQYTYCGHRHWIKILSLYLWWSNTSKPECKHYLLSCSMSYGWSISIDTAQHSNLQWFLKTWRPSLALSQLLSSETNNRLMGRAYLP